MIRCCFISILLALCAPCAAQSLRTFSTDHYNIHTDLDSALANDLGHRMEVMWTEYSRRLCDFAPPGNAEKLEVYLFTYRHDYMRLTGDRFPNTGGIFIPSKNLLAAFLETQGQDGIRRTLQHEAFHQFAHAAIGDKLPVWLNEGIAQIFEEGIWTGHDFLIGQVPPRRVQILQDDIRENRLTDFATFIDETNAQWASNLRYKPIAVTQYNQAWAMTQFLIYATDEQGHPRYRDRLLDMLREIHVGRSGHSAFVDCFSDNLTGFRLRFNEWAHNLGPTAQATYTEHQEILADMLMSLGARGRQFNDIASFRRCLDEGGYHLQWGTVNLLSTGNYFCDLTGQPLGPEQLYFSATPGAIAPDIICHPVVDLQLRTRFLRNRAGELDYETVVESE